MDGGGSADDYIKSVKRAIEDWHKEAPSILGYAASVMAKMALPVGWLVSKVVPVGAVMGALSGGDWVAKNTVSSAASADLDDLRACDRGAGQVQDFHISLAAAVGGGGGFLGLPGMIADTPVSITLAMRCIRQVGVEYGYGEDKEEERQFCFGVLQSAGANTLQQKIAAHAALQRISVMLAKKAFKEMAANAAGQAIGFEAAIMGVRALAKELGVNLTKRKMLAAIPIIGAVVGATSNAWFMREVGTAAQRAFQERWLIDRDWLIVDPGIQAWEDNSSLDEDAHYAKA